MRVADAGDIELVFETVIAAFALFVGSATLVAVIVCEPFSTGALYNPDASMGPVFEFPPATASTDHVTAEFVVPVTVTLNCMVAPAATFVSD